MLKIHLKREINPHKIKKDIFKNKKTFEMLCFVHVFFTLIYFSK